MPYKMFSNNTDLVDHGLKKDVEDRLWMEDYIDKHMRNIYMSFIKGFYEKLSDNLKTQTLETKQD